MRRVVNIEGLSAEPTEHGMIRLIGTTREPLDLTEVRLIAGAEGPGTEVTKLGVYPAEMGTHWSDQPHGRAGWYYLIGPVPIEILTDQQQAEVEAYQSDQADGLMA